MTFNDTELYNICNQLSYLRRDRADYDLSRHRPRPWDDDAPKVPGFNYLGAGKDREVWGYGGFAFKLQHPSSSRATSCANEAEYHNWLRITSKTALPPNWYIPSMRLVEANQEPVIVTEHVTAPLLCDIPDWDDLLPHFEDDLEKMGIHDIADVNYAYDAHTGKIYVLDLTE